MSWCGLFLCGQVLMHDATAWGTSKLASQNRVKQERTQHLVPLEQLLNPGIAILHGFLMQHRGQGLV